MSIFAVLLNESKDSIEEEIAKISKQKPYKINDTTFLVTSDELTSDISDSLGMNDEGTLKGVVLRLNSARSGWFTSSIWEWFHNAEGKANE